MKKFLGVFSILLIINGCATDVGRGTGPGYSSPGQSPGEPVEPALSSPAEIPSAGQPEAIPPGKSTVFRGPSAGDNAPPPRNSPAVIALIGQADKAQQAGDLALAAAKIERGLRIMPHDARLWHKLARIRLAQDRPQQAESLAKKSNSLARGNRKLLFANWMTIAEARELRGDKKGKARAQREARKYQ